jgi:hypothetical protein
MSTPLVRGQGTDAIRITFPDDGVQLRGCRVIIDGNPDMARAICRVLNSPPSGDARSEHTERDGSDADVCALLTDLAVNGIALDVWGAEWAAEARRRAAT